MNNEDILKSDLIDLIFDKRNKNYGAYELRKHYKRRLLKAVLVAFVFAAGFAALISFIKEDKLLTSVFDIPDSEPVILAKVEAEKKKPVEPKKAPIAKPPVLKPVAQHKFVDNIVIVKNESEADKLASNLDNFAIGNKTVAGEPYKGEVYVDPPVTIGADGKDVPVVTVDKETPRLTAEKMPAFPGGLKALRKFLEKNLRSFDDIEPGTTISVKITFIVGYDGKLKGFQVLEDGGDMYNKEVIRVLKKMPEWEPGRSNGENVSVYYTIPVKFAPAE